MPTKAILDRDLNKLDRLIAGMDLDKLDRRPPGAQGVIGSPARLVSKDSLPIVKYMCGVPSRARSSIVTSQLVSPSKSPRTRAASSTFQMASECPQGQVSLPLPVVPFKTTVWGLLRFLQ